MGRGSEVEGIARRMRTVGSSIGLLRYPAAFGEIQALIFTGRLDEARRRAEEYPSSLRQGSISHGV